MKKIIASALLVLCITLIVAVVPTEAEGAIYEDTVRLHILANSDTKEDQELKLKIRDDILCEFSGELTALNSTDEAKESLSLLLPEIEEFAKQRVSYYGYEYKVRVSLGTEWYDTRKYDDLTLPKGYYTSLKIIIGEGEGKNWWCVMYPPMCVDIATEKAPRDDAIKKYTSSEINLISSKRYNAKFKILEVASGIFS